MRLTCAHVSAPVARAAPHGCAAAAGTGLAAAGLGAGASPWLCAAAVAAGSVIAAVAEGVTALAGLMLALAAAALLFGAARVEHTRPSPLRLTPGAAVMLVVDGPVASRRGGGWRVIGTVRAGDGRVPAGARLLVWIGRGPAPASGEVIGLRGTVAPAGGDGPAWWRRYLERARVRGVVRVRGVERVGRRGGVAGVRDAAVAAMLRRSRAVVGGDTGAIVTGIGLGYDELLSDRARSAFRDSGLSHLLAVSGQNVALVALAVMAALSAAGAGRMPVLGVAAAAVVSYGFLCQPGPSVARATIVGLVAIAAEMLARPHLRWHVLLVALVALLAWQPRAVGDPGLLLSFSAVAGILLLARPLAAGLEGRLPRPLALGVAVGASATAATLPVAAALFGRVSLVGLPATLVAVPLAAVVLVTGLAGAAAASVAPGLGDPLLLVAAGGAEGLRLLAHTAAAIPGAAVDVPAWAAVPAAVPVTVMAAMSAGRRSPPPGRGRRGAR